MAKIISRYPLPVEAGEYGYSGDGTGSTVGEPEDTSEERESTTIRGSLKSKDPRHLASKHQSTGHKGSTRQDPGRQARRKRFSSIQEHHQSSDEDYSTEEEQISAKRSSLSSWKLKERRKMQLLAMDACESIGITPNVSEKARSELKKQVAKTHRLRNDQELSSHRSVRPRGERFAATRGHFNTSAHSTKTQHKRHQRICHRPVHEDVLQTREPFSFLTLMIHKLLKFET